MDRISIVVSKDEFKGAIVAKDHLLVRRASEEIDFLAGASD